MPDQLIEELNQGLLKNNSSLVVRVGPKTTLSLDPQSGVLTTQLYAE